MKRRTFLHAIAGGAASMSFAAARSRAQSTLPPLLITVEAAGAWDPTFHCDPHGISGVAPYTLDDVRMYAQLPTAPRVSRTAAALSFGGFMVPRVGAGSVDFFEQHAGRLRVINGVDHRSVIHAAAARGAFAGSLREGTPSLAALAAVAENARGTLSKPFPFISTGGTDDTGGIVGVTRLRGVDVLRVICGPAQSEFGQAVVVDPVVEAVRLAQLRRDQRLLLQARAQNRVAFAAALEATIASRATEPTFAGLADQFAARAVPSTDAFVALVGMVLTTLAQAPPACAAVHLSLPGFDTHGRHDQNHTAALTTLFTALDYLITQLDTAADLDAVRQRGVMVFVSSDFGRTKYNGGEDNDGDTSALALTRGKDHWPITSAWLIGVGAAAARITPGVIGLTHASLSDESDPNAPALAGLSADRLVCEDNRKLSVDSTSTAGFQLNSSDIALSLRRELELDVMPAAAAFALTDANAQIVAALAAGGNPVLRDS